MHLSERGADFVARHEGFVSRAYRDPVGVLTIGTGFTNRSRAFRAYWQKTRGHDLRPGDTIGRAENAKILKTVADGEYGAAVNRDIAPAKQHHYDAATSVCFNLGPGAAKWRWARALRDGDVAGAAHLLRQTGTTAGGRRLAGLVARRRHEAALLETGDYGDGGAVAFDRDEDNAAPRPAVRPALLRHYQEALRSLGYDPGPLDGVYGERTRAAVRRYQVFHPHLKSDGILGPATMAAIDRAMAARKAAPKAGIGAAGAAAATGAAAAVAGDWMPLVIAAGAVVLTAGIAAVAWRYRDEIIHRIKD